MKILKCSRCAAHFAVAHLDPDDYTTLARCPGCGLTEFAYILAGRRKAADNPLALGQPAQVLAAIKALIDRLQYCADVNREITDTAAAFGLSPAILVAILNDMLRAPQVDGVYNPERFVTLKPGSVSIDDLMEEVKRRANSQGYVDPQPIGPNTDWLKRYEEVKAHLDSCIRENEDLKVQIIQLKRKIKELED